MASKRTGTRKTSNEREQAKAAFRLFAKRAQTEIAKLLKQTSSGTITQRELRTGLQEVKGDLKQMLAHKRHLL